MIDTDKKVVRLVTTLKDAYTFTCDAFSLPDKAAKLERCITGLVKQTIECCLFVENDKIDEFEQSLRRFEAIESDVNLQTALVSVDFIRD